MDPAAIEAFIRLSDILDTLRKKCPWDSVQTIHTLRYLTIEEVYELSEAVLQVDEGHAHDDEFKKELGDLFMHLMFYSKIAEDERRFSLADVLNAISDKLVARHPAIYPPPEGASKAESWEQLKMHEGRKSVLEGVPESLPALNKAVRMQEKVSGMGFEFDSADDAFAKVREEYAEFEASGTAEEFGDLLFALVKWGAMKGINADDALCRTNLKFKARFQYLEAQARKQGRRVDELSKQEMLALWNEAKSLSR